MADNGSAQSQDTKMVYSFLIPNYGNGLVM